MFWIFAIAITAIACAALYYAARGRRVNATPAAQMTSDDDATTAHFQLQLREIDGDIVDIGTAQGALETIDPAASRLGDLGIEHRLIRARMISGGDADDIVNPDQGLV